MLTNTLPISTTFVWVTPGSPTCNYASGQVMCNLDSLSAGVSAQVTVQATVNVSTTAALINTLRVTANESRSHVPNNTITRIVFVNPWQVFMPLTIR